MQIKILYFNGCPNWKMAATRLRTVLAELGRTDVARAHVAVMLKMRPAFTVREADAYYRTWCFAPPFREKMQQALRAAGLPE